MCPINNSDATPISLPTFLPPGPGEWKIIDHIVHPGTRCFMDYYFVPMESGWNEAALNIGTLNRVKICEVNGFMYYQMGMVESEQEILDMCKKNEGYWTHKRYLEALSHWDETIKPGAIKQLSELQQVNLTELTEKELIKHLELCFSVTQQMVKNHHLFTYPAFIPVGDFIFQVCEWTHVEPINVLNILAGSAPNRLFLAHGYPNITELLHKLQKNATAIYLLTKAETEPENSKIFLEQLISLHEDFRDGLQFILDHFGYRIVNGYDIASETLIERPDIFLKSIKSILSHKTYKKNIDIQNDVDSILGKLPEEKKVEFEAMLSDARKMERLRDERGTYTDLWAIGILRNVYLEAGKRLVQRGEIASPESVIDASIQELASLIDGTPIVTLRELEERCQYRSSFDVKDVPTTLNGDPPTQSPIPDLSRLPPSIVRTMNGLLTTIKLAVDHVHFETKEKDTLVGEPASKGIVEGTAKVIRSDSQVNEINRGDILVVYQTTAAFNTVFPLVKGVISQNGGILSHPAILAREYEIPCVVGCSGAMEKIKTGMQIHLDGNEGIVKIIPQSEHIEKKLKGLVCDYSGPMQGRNRNRVYNHLGEVTKRLSIVEELRKSGRCRETLQKHFYEEITTEEAADQIIKHTKNEVNKQLLETFTRRDHVEFHPCDACNLSCSGCTYFHDLPSGPDPVSFPIKSINKICSSIQPKAITIVGGGEPTLYKSGKFRLGDLINSIGNGEYDCTPAIGLITNGTLWVPGNPTWHHHVDWIRYSLDTSSAESYLIRKGKDYFDIVVDNVIRTLTDTNIPLVSVGFLYHPGTIVETGSLISNFAKLIKNRCMDQIDRFSIQFRPWRLPIGNPAINERILSQQDIEDAALDLFHRIEQEPFLEQFIRRNTNIAVNLLCGGAREKVSPFSECYFGLAKSVIRANGSIYPCFRVAADHKRDFYCGNIVSDTALKIALRELYVHIYSAKNICTPNYESCLFCVFNNMLEHGARYKPEIQQGVAGDYFF